MTILYTLTSITPAENLWKGSFISFMNSIVTALTD